MLLEALRKPAHGYVAEDDLRQKLQNKVVPHSWNHVLTGSPPKLVLGPHRRETSGSTKDLGDMEVVRRVVQVRGGKGERGGAILHRGRNRERGLRVPHVQFVEHLLRGTPCHPVRGEQLVCLGGVARLDEGQGVIPQPVRLGSRVVAGETVVIGVEAGSPLGGGGGGCGGPTEGRAARQGTLVKEPPLAILEELEVPGEKERGDPAWYLRRRHKQELGQHVEELEEPVSMGLATCCPQLFDQTEDSPEGIPPTSKEVWGDKRDSGSSGAQQSGRVELREAPWHPPHGDRQVEDIGNTLGPSLHMHPPQQLQPAETVVPREAGILAGAKLEQGEGLQVLRTGQTGAVCTVEVQTVW
jgi:hypothetical protein